MASPQFVAAGALCAAAVVLAACTGASRVDPATAAVLADRAERLADHIDADAHCEALTEADALLQMTARGVDDGAIAVGMAAEVEAVVADITTDLGCDTDDDEAPKDHDEVDDGDDTGGHTEQPRGKSDKEARPDNDDKGNAGKGKGKGNGKGKGKGKGGG